MGLIGYTSQQATTHTLPWHRTILRGHSKRIFFGVYLSIFAQAMSEDSINRKSKLSASAYACKMSLIAIPFIGAITPTFGAAADVTSADGSTVVSGSGNQIDIAGGVTSGRNQFHSFDNFSVDTGETVNFISHPDSQNILGRIDSNQPSTINGSLRVSGSNANLYLMNPAGLLIGPDANLNLAGGFTATTATGIELGSEQFRAEGSNSYSQLTSAPSAFHFENSQPGAVVNLGDLAVNSGKSITLVGGTVINAGQLSASDTDIALMAVEGGSIVRLQNAYASQQVLSLEIEASAISSAITPASIGEMLTGSGLSNATELVLEADGSVKLGSEGETIVEGSGNLMLADATDAVDIVANHILLSAANNITVGAKGTERFDLRFSDEATVEIIADADSNNSGQFVMHVDTESGVVNDIMARGGDITISGAGITVDHVRTEPGSNRSNSAGSISLTSSSSLLARRISTNTYTNSNNAKKGGDITLEANGGDLTVLEEVRSWTNSGGNNAGDGGNITISAIGDIDLGRVTSVSNTESNNAGSGGDVSITAAGDITAQSIDTRSRAASNNASDSGSVSLVAPNGAIAVDRIVTASVTGKNNAGNGGTVYADAENIEINAINSQTIANNGGKQAGAVVLEARRELTVDRIFANSVANDGESNDIYLAGDAINLTGTANSIDGRTVYLSSDKSDQEIRLGLIESGLEDSDILDITASELSAFNQGIEKIVVGHSNYIGVVEVLPEAIEDANNRPPIEIVGGGLLAPDTTNTFLLTGEGSGSLQDSNLSFSRIASLQGGSLEDTFIFSNNITPSSFSADIDGGGGFDTAQYDNNNQAVSISDLLDLNVSLIEATGNQRILEGDAADRVWVIDGVNRGYVSSGELGSRVQFKGFSTLAGGTGVDRFEIEEGGWLEGSVIGGENNNTIATSIKDTRWIVSGEGSGTLELSETESLAFSEIQNLQNTSSSLMDSVLFESSNARIEGSIDSGSASLELIGDSIRLGSEQQRASLLGTGQLILRPLTASQTIEINASSNPSILNFIEGNISNSLESFDEIVVGSAQHTGDIFVEEDINLETSLTLQSQGDIQAARANFIGSNADSNITLESLSGNIFIRDVEVEGGDVTLQASQNIEAGRIATHGDRANGTLYIASDNGNIVSGGITTSSQNSKQAVVSGAGDVELLSRQGSIDIEFIDARGTDGTGASINLNAGDRIAVRDTIRGSNASISTGNARGGEVSIEFGRSDRPAELLSIGRSSARGSSPSAHLSNSISNFVAGSIETESASIQTDEFVGDRISEGIRIINNGDRITALETQPAAEAQLAIPTIDAASSGVVAASRSSAETLQTISINNSTQNSRIATNSIFSQVELSTGATFSNYLGIENAQKRPDSIHDVQDTLSRVQTKTSTVPALVYAYFVPDAQEEDSVVAGIHRPIRDNDQLEVMVISPEGDPVRKRQWGVTRAQVREASQQLRQQVTSEFSTARQYLPPAQQLYNWIIAPIAETLDNAGTNSLGFVMADGLRTLPMGALHDGDRYLVENYSLGLLPTFSLTNFGEQDATGVDFATAEVLAMGASEFENNAELPAAKAEVDLIARQLWEGDAFINEAFTAENLQKQLQENDYGVVHLATHASFTADDLDSSYIQMWNEKLSLNDVSKLGLDKLNIGLIILSACNTALGDQASEYGFAGFAVSAGSESALASIWPVNDEGTLGFMSQFYTELRASETRAEALRAAQISLINSEVGIADGEIYGPEGKRIVTLPTLAQSGRWDFSHPFYWAAFTMIGNPW